MVGKLLLFEDNLSVGRFVAVNLRKRGYFLIETATLHELPGLAALYNPSLILFEFSGFVTCEWDTLVEMAETSPLDTIPVILLSGAGLPELSAIRSIPRNVIGLLQKPVGVDDLVGKVKQVLDERTSIDQLDGLFGTM